MVTNPHGLNNSWEFEKLFAFYAKAFIKTPLVFFKKRINNDPYLIPNDIRIWEEDDKILSSVTVFRRAMYWQGNKISFGGIGNVSTLPEKRSLGLSSKVMKDTVKYIEEIPMDVSILFTGINSFYEKFNFFTIPTYYLTFNISGSSESNYSVRNFNEADLGMVSKIYESFNKNLCGPIVRDIDYWKANLRFAEEDEIFLVAEKQNTIEGYIRIVPGESKNNIWEFGFSNIEAFNALIFTTSKLLNKKELKTAALCPLNFIGNNVAYNISYEPSSIAMALIKRDISSKYFFQEDFNKYCFWWTDNF